MKKKEDWFPVRN